MPMRREALLLGLIAVLLLPLQGWSQETQTLPELPALPSEEAPALAEEPDKFLTGDWGGVRTDLSNSGVNFIFNYTGEVLSNVSGGRSTGSAYDGLLLSGVDIDIEKLGGWKG